jgi:ADP-ribose diphosphatase
MAWSAPTSAWSAGAGYGAVMIVAMLDAEHAVLVEEYCGGTDEYELSLPKGLIEPGEDVLAAADRELKEEAGFGARQLEHLTELSLSPGYMSQKIQVVLATDLYEERLEGDEPEPMRVDKVNLRELSAWRKTRSSAKAAPWRRCTWPVTC